MLDDLDLTMPCSIPSVATAHTMIASTDSATDDTTDNSSRDTVDDSPVTQDLPKRQREVLELMLRGFSAKEIAVYLGISRHTVNDYSKALYRHFAVSGRAELTALFIRSSASSSPVAAG
ncbi:MAG: helix-turn-helix domain-containing protein, partial [Akkermansiaceae bacterium]|nr:helix-turn-helix domain-containing protein [Akkermansiaceae bacterium]